MQEAVRKVRQPNNNAPVNPLYCYPLSQGPPLDSYGTRLYWDHVTHGENKEGKIHHKSVLSIPLHARLKVRFVLHTFYKAYVSLVNELFISKQCQACWTLYEI